MCRVWLGNVKAGDYLRDLQAYVEGGIILKGILKIYDGAGRIDWINLAKTRVK